MKVKGNLWPAGALLLLAGCTYESMDPVQPPVPPAPGSPRAGSHGHHVSFSTLERNRNGFLLLPTFAVFFTRTQCDSTLAAWAGEGRLIFTPPPALSDQVRWKQGEILVLASAGQFPSGPSEIEIVGIERDGKTATCRLVIRLPGPYQYLTEPIHIVKLNRRGLENFEAVYDFEPWPW